MDFNGRDVLVRVYTPATTRWESGKCTMFVPLSPLRGKMTPRKSPRPTGGMLMFNLSILALFLAVGSPNGKDEKRRFDRAADLAAPVRLEAAGKPIDTAVGHPAPFVGDMDGDGINDLLVGQFGDGILWIYKNQGTNKAPKLGAGIKFKEGKEDGRVPTG